jgi:hypothetical protein
VTILSLTTALGLFWHCSRSLLTPPHSPSSHHQQQQMCYLGQISRFPRPLCRRWLYNLLAPCLYIYVYIIYMYIICYVYMCVCVCVCLCVCARIYHTHTHTHKYTHTHRLGGLLSKRLHSAPLIMQRLHSLFNFCFLFLFIYFIFFKEWLLSAPASLLSTCSLCTNSLTNSLI